MQSGEEDQEIAIFEEDEVVWAKIRGYPWWPAFIDTIHEAKGKSGQPEYTVLFFGDNTQLGASKLRKYMQYYVECYQKAKTTRKLLASILMAEERLGQNGHDVSVFQEMKQATKPKRKLWGRHPRSTEMLTMQDESSSHEAPDLPGRSLTAVIHDQNMSDAAKSAIVISSEVVQSEKCGSVASSEKQIISEKQEQEGPKPSHVKEKPAPNKRKLISKRVGRLGRQRLPALNPSEYDQNELSNSVEVTSKQQMEQQKAEIYQISDDEIVEQAPAQIIAKPKRTANTILRRSIINQPPAKASQFKPTPRRAAKQKSQILNRNLTPSVDNLSNSGQESSSQINEPKRRKVNQKAGRQEAQMERDNSVEPEQKDSSLEEVEKVKKCIARREDLIECLNRIEITVGNVQELLELKIVDMLKSGEITHAVTNLLQTLRATLLYRHFKDDVKMKKAHERCQRKRILVTHQSSSSKKPEDTLTPQLCELRKKTTRKLQQIIKKGYSLPNDQIRSTAIQIEQLFFSEDNSVGEGYRSMAYDCLRSLKDKKQTIENILRRLSGRQQGTGYV